ncbi:MAG: insulinase family protein [Candidatus Azobacteroides sp.]|nr:insulinase family protein [Candidatus Azobacteroides sp.]
MNTKTKFLGLLMSVIFSTSLVLAQQTYSYQTYPNDPLNAKVYTLSNGLTVMMTVYKDAPRIQTYIAVKVGGKNDPKETTGLAHYFEHMMFKGTQKFGTVNWEKEKPMIQKIEDLFEIYRTTTDSVQRKAIYRQIDSVSYEASKLSIPNEYDKLMSAIGSKGSNASTSYDYTIYVENIPSNELNNWAKIQAERFNDPVLRLFHTELETVYEEKNMSLTRDNRRVFEEILKTLFPNHPYGQQTILGTTENLKNPSMKNIREFYAKYYVPDNMAICLSGDFDPDQAVAEIDKYFNILKPGVVPEFQKVPEAPITAPIVKEITGLEAENTNLAYRIDAGNGTREAIILDMINNILYNGKCGLLDLNINQKQKAIGVWGSSMTLNDYSLLMIAGRPKTGQSLEELKDLFSAQIDLLKKGEFPDWMFEAALNNKKLDDMKRYESNQGRATSLAEAFMSNMTWGDALNETEELKKLTKKDIVDFANKYFNDDYVVIYKKQGTPPDIQKVEKPSITPIYVNRDEESPFFESIVNAKISPIQPVFVDFDKDLQRGKTKNGTEILYAQNKENGTFSLYYYFKSGSSSNKKLSLAAGYLNYLGTSGHSPEEIQQEFYKLACDYTVLASADETYVGVSGLDENMGKAVALLEELITDPAPNQEALDNYIADMLKNRADAKSSQGQIFSVLTNYGTYEKNSPSLDILSEAELKAVTTSELIGIIKKMTSYGHTVLYYGPSSIASVTSALNKLHKMPEQLLPVLPPKRYEPISITSDRLYFVNYDANQSYMAEITKGEKFSKAFVPQVEMYNNYFDGSMNSIVFQEMREKRSLAYSASAYYKEPSYSDGYYLNNAFIATQNDKIIDALDAFNDLFENMPLSEKGFKLAQEAIISNINTQRITKMNIIWNYLSNQKMGYTSDRRKDVYDHVPQLTLDDVKTFNDKYIKNRNKTYLILGRESDINFEILGKYGDVKKLSLEEIFGY